MVKVWCGLTSRGRAKWLTWRTRRRDDASLFWERLAVHPSLAGATTTPSTTRVFYQSFTTLFAFDHSDGRDFQRRHHSTQCPPRQNERRLWPSLRDKAAHVLTAPKVLLHSALPDKQCGGVVKEPYSLGPARHCSCVSGLSGRSQPLFAVSLSKYNVSGMIKILKGSVDGHENQQKKSQNTTPSQQ